MKQELAIITTSEIMSIGKAFAESGMFPDIKSAAQAVVKIQAGAEIGLPPFASMSGIHIIQGKPTVGAGLIAATVKGSGKYDYRIIEQSEKICSIDFFQGKEKLGNSTFTIEDAKKAGTKNMDKHPKNMLFARAVSNGVKWFCPDIFSGPVYTPEEFDATPITEDVKHEVIDPAAKSITEVYLTTTVKSLQKLWEKNPDLHNHAAFKAAVNTRKGQLSIDDKELAHEVKELEGQQ